MTKYIPVLAAALFATSAIAADPATSATSATSSISGNTSSSAQQHRQTQDLHVADNEGMGSHEMGMTDANKKASSSNNNKHIKPQPHKAAGAATGTVKMDTHAENEKDMNKNPKQE